jgi:hypothetical protein
LEKLYHRVHSVPEHNGIGPGGVVDDLLQWSIELLTYYRECGEVLHAHWVPNIKGMAKRTTSYEALFIETALALIPLLPRAIVGGLCIRLDSETLYLLVEYPEGETLPGYNELKTIDPSHFIRPKKIRSRT